MMLSRWPMPKWLKYAAVGAISYPAAVLMLLILAFTATPFGFRPVFESMIKVVVYPASSISLRIAYEAIANPMDYGIVVILLILVFTVLSGALLGLVAFFVRRMYHFIKS